MRPAHQSAFLAIRYDTFKEVILVASDREYKAAMAHVSAAIRNNQKPDKRDMDLTQKMANQAGWGMPSDAKRALKGKY